MIMRKFTSNPAQSFSVVSYMLPPTLSFTLVLVLVNVPTLWSFLIQVRAPNYHVTYIHVCHLLVENK